MTTNNGPRIVVTDNAPREQWLAARAERVTASEIAQIHNGTLKTWRKILDDKLNGQTFQGNAHTRRGQAREPLLMDAAREIAESFGWALTENRALWATAENPAHAATPDGVGVDKNGNRVGAEVKSLTKHPDRIDPKHYAQCQWGMYVLDASEWLYLYEVINVEEPGLAPIEFMVVNRDDDYISALIDAADRFLAWRDAGAPASDPLSDDLAEILEQWVAAKHALKAAADHEKQLAAQLKLAARALPHAWFGVTRTGATGGFQLSIPQKTEIDETAWRKADLVGYECWLELKNDLEEVAQAARDRYPKIVAGTPRLTLVEAEARDE